MCPLLLLSALPKNVVELAIAISCIDNGLKQSAIFDPSENDIVGACWCPTMVNQRNLLIRLLSIPPITMLTNGPSLLVVYNPTHHIPLNLLPLSLSNQHHCSTADISNMPFDSPAHRDRLRMLATYVASSSFTNSSGWALAKTGHMLVEKPSGQETLAIGVAKVLDYKLFCGPTGNYNEKFKGTTPLEKAKYTFTVGRPDEMAFHEDYDKLFSNLEKVQSSISFGNDRRNMLDASTRTIRFSGLVFHERVSPLSLSTSTTHLF